MTESILFRIAEGRKLPEGCDRWALKSTDFAGRTYGGFKWPEEGWVKAPGPFRSDNDSSCPAAEGDGLCVARTYGGMASGGHRAMTMLLVAYAAEDVLGDNDLYGEKMRVRRAYVVERLDGEEVLRRYGQGADLERANLSGMHLSGIDLSYANLSNAALNRANLAFVNFRGADLYGTNLAQADLSHADFRGASLESARIDGANLTGVVLDDGEVTR